MPVNPGKDTILQGSVFKPLIRFAIPLMLSTLLQALYGAVDLIVVGKFGTTSGVSAVSNGSQIMHAITQIVVGLTMGVTVLVGRHVGAREDEQAAQTVGAAVRLFAVVGLILTVLTVVFTEQIVRLMQVPEQAVAGAASYLRICGLGMVFITAFNVITGLMRGLGDSKSPLIFIAIAAAVNILGDLLLCGVFKLDVAGAAIATVFAQMCSVIFAVFKIRREGLPFAFGKQHLRRTGDFVSRILKTGGPVAMQDFLVSVSFLIIFAILNTLGLVASASIGIAEKLFVFLALVPLSFMYALSAFVAQNIGAKQPERAVAGMRVGMITSFVAGVFMFVLVYFRGDLLAMIFERDPQVIAATHNYLQGTAAEYLILPILFCFIGYFNGLAKTRFVLIEGLISSFIFRIPLCYFLSQIPNAQLMTIGYSVPISSFASLLMCLAYYFTLKKRSRSLQPE